ncbi:TonB-dependent receptor [Ketobacter sp.]
MSTNFVTASLLLVTSLSAYADTTYNRLTPVEVEGTAIGQPGLSLETENTQTNRLGMTAMETPASVEVIDQESLSKKGDYSSQSAVTRATGFASGASPGNGSSAVSVRGFSGHSSVAYTYDGARLYVGAGTVSFPADTWTVERVEVLRGPGSVIHGVGAIGATINYVPKKPTLTPVESEIDVTLGSNNLARVALGSGGALSDSVGYRLDAVQHQTDGYIDRADEERTAVAAAVMYQPGDRFSATLNIDYSDTDAAPYWGTPLVEGAVSDAVRRNNYNVEDGRVAYQDSWPRLHLEWKLSDVARLRNDTYYMQVERHWRNVESYDYNPATGLVERSDYLEIRHEQEQLGNRSDVVFDFNAEGMPNRLSVGVEVNRINFSHINNSPYSGASGVDLLNPIPGLWTDHVSSETSADFDTETRQYAFFVDNIINLNEQWSVVSGIRYDDMDYQRHDLARSNGQTEGDMSSDLDGTSWRLGAVFKPASHVSLYAQYSSAVDGIQSLLSATDPTLKLAQGEQFEIGIKHEPIARRLQYTVALYDISKNNLLSQDLGGVQRQIGEQTSRGIEFDLFWTPAASLSMEFNLALVDPEYQEFVSGGDDYRGNTPRRVPQKTANLWIDWQFAPGWSTGSGVRYVGKRYLDDANSAELPDYAVWDAVLEWALSPDLKFSLRGRNLTGTDDYVLAPYGNQWVLGDGRTAELGMRFQF